MTKYLTIPAAVLTAAVTLAPGAGAFTQQAKVMISPTSGTLAPKGKTYVKLNAYLSTRDPLSTRGTLKANPVGTVSMKFPTGSVVNKAAVGSSYVCQQSEYSPLATLSAACSKAIIGTGWALLNSGSPVPQPQITGAPPACAVGDATQYTRTWQGATSTTKPASAPNCVPIGDIYTKVTAYQGGILSSKYWCYGPAWYTQPADSFKGKACDWKDATGRVPNRTISGKDANGVDIHNVAYTTANNGCNVIFANDNGVAPLAFGGAVAGCGNALSVVIPALNGSGSGLGELTGGVVLSDFRLGIGRTNFLKAGACPTTKRFTVATHLTYSKLKGEASLPASNPASADVSWKTVCRV